MNTAPFQIELGSSSVPVQFVRHRKSRRYILRMLPEGVARVTIPRGGSTQQGFEFLQKNRGWIEKQLRQAPAEWGCGTIFLFRGEMVTIDLLPTAAGHAVTAGPLRFEIGVLKELRPAIEQSLRRLATPELISRARELSIQLGVPIAGVSVRNQRSRWGSCSVRGRISLNWRLIQTPEFVRDYIIIHELMHMREMNHSARFWRQVEGACPHYKEAERWLRKHAKLLK